MNFSKCHASKCAVIEDRKRWREVDVLLLTDGRPPDGIRPPGQLWFAANEDSPLHIPMADSLENELDVYGGCGSFSCPKDYETSSDSCLKMIRENYKFYLSFENSLCTEYITEKLYKNALNVIKVMNLSICMHNHVWLETRKQLLFSDLKDHVSQQ
ncbi:unnamed protein product [Schistosoma spindalis]|nr:unnamed protein product [Schistosoma spindale]